MGRAAEHPVPSWRPKLPTISLLIGYQVLEAEVGALALAVWATHRKEIDLLFGDMVVAGA